MGSYFSLPTLTPEQMASTKERVNTIIADNKVVVFSKTHCPYCRKAKALLAELNVEAFILELDNEEDGPAIQAALLDLTGQRTVPNIFIGQKHIGGCDSLVAAKNNGSLKTILANL